MTPTQKQAFVSMLLAPLLAGPLYYLIAAFTMPIGLGLLMVVLDKWVLAMYPLLFMGQEYSRDVVVYSLGTAVSFPLTVLQWVLIAWLYSRKAPDAKPAVQLARALGIAFLIGLVLFFILRIAGIHMASPYRFHL